MPQPYNYIPQGGFGANNYARFSQGLQGISRGMESIGQARQQEAMAQRKAEGQKRILQMLEGGADSKDFLAFSVEFPEMTDQAKAISANLSKEVKDNLFMGLANVWAPLKAGNADSALEEADRLETAFRNGGLVDHADGVGAIKRALSLGGESGLRQAKLLTDMIMSGTAPEAFSKMVGGLETQATAGDKEADTATKIEELKQSIANAQSESDLKKYNAQLKGLEVKVKKEAVKKMKNPPPPEVVKKLRTAEAVKEYQGHKENLQASVGQGNKLKLIQNMLVDETGKKIKIGGAGEGLLDSVTKWFEGKPQGSAERGVLLSQLAGMRMSEAFKFKQAGPMSDTEMNQYLQAVPGPESSDEVLALYVITSQRVLDAQKKADMIRMKYLERQGDITTADKDFTINVMGEEIKVKKGDFVEQVIADAVPAIEVPRSSDAIPSDLKEQGRSRSRVSDQPNKYEGWSMEIVQ